MQVRTQERAELKGGRADTVGLEGWKVSAKRMKTDEQEGGAYEKQKGLSCHTS